MFILDLDLVNHVDSHQVCACAPARLEKGGKTVSRYCFGFYIESVFSLQKIPCTLYSYLINRRLFW